MWTGEELVFWGGSLGIAGDTNSGARYRPETDTWTPMSTSGAPSPREKHTAVWTGERVLFWGGHDGDYELDTGGSYDPSTDTWTPLSTSAAPEGRDRHTAIWTGDRMLIWGGDGLSGYQNTGTSYDPVTDSWTPTTNANAPPPRIADRSGRRRSHRVEVARGAGRRDHQERNKRSTGC